MILCEPVFNNYYRPRVVTVATQQVALKTTTSSRSRGKVSSKWRLYLNIQGAGEV